MRKIVFTLRPNIQGINSVLARNLDISTHKGARLTIYYDHPSVLDVTDDEMSDSELQTWYKSRYSGFGLGIKILKDNEIQITPAAPEVSAIKVSEEIKYPVIQPEKSVIQEVPVKVSVTTPVKVDTVETDESVKVDKVEAIESAKVDNTESSSESEISNTPNSDLTDLLFGSMLNETTVTEKPVENPEIKGSKVESK